MKSQPLGSTATINDTACAAAPVGASPLADDLLIGSEAIAAYTGSFIRQVRWRCETRQWPAFRLGSKWCMRKSTWQAYIAQLEAAAIAAMSAKGNAGTTEQAA